MEITVTLVDYVWVVLGVTALQSTLITLKRYYHHIGEKRRHIMIEHKSAGQSTCFGSVEFSKVKSGERSPLTMKTDTYFETHHGMVHHFHDMS